MLNFNCALMLVLMLRKHITWLRSKGGSILLPLDNHIDIHKTIGLIILVETALHTAAHLAYLAYVFQVCALPKDVGYACRTQTSYNQSESYPLVHTRLYRFDSAIDECVPFGYLGCGGNWNRFTREDLCATRCSK